MRGTTAVEGKAFGIIAEAIPEAIGRSLRATSPPASSSIEVCHEATLHTHVRAPGSPPDGALVLLPAHSRFGRAAGDAGRPGLRV